jgi:hypothetical protein
MLTASPCTELTRGLERRTERDWTHARPYIPRTDGGLTAPYNGIGQLQANGGHVALSAQYFFVGRAIVTGKSASPRAPYFHNGSAATLDEALDFYVTRFGVSFTAQERADLIHFLNAL